MKVVLDTNTVVSALLWDGIPLKVYQGAKSRFVMLTSDDLATELRSVIHRAKFAPLLATQNLTVEQVMRLYSENSEAVSPTKVPEDVVRDPKDRIVLECAVGGQADYIISGDKDLLTLECYENIPIINANAFLEKLGSESP